MSGKDDDDGDENDRKETGSHRSSMVCVNCGNFVQSVFIEYSPGNIRLSNCAKCEAVVDKYVEYEIMIVIIDVILHKYEAYRHAFFNYPRLNKLNLQRRRRQLTAHDAKALIWKAALCSLLLDTWRWTCHGDEQVTAQVAFLNCVYLFAIMVTLNMLSKGKYSMKSKYQDVFLAVLFSSHFKFFVFAMMVWEFSFLMGLMVDLLVLTSNLVALEVMLNASRFHAAAAVTSGAISKCLMLILLRYTC